MWYRLSLLFAVALMTATPARAQEEAILSELYGSGVHAYFSGQYFEADRLLSSAIDQGTKDPRAYYFRAMTNLRLGRADAAQNDMAKGAELEIDDVDGRYAVGRSMERVQGQGRLQVEQHRRKARLVALQRKQERDTQRYEAIYASGEQAGVPGEQSVLRYRNAAIEDGVIAG